MNARNKHFTSIIQYCMTSIIFEFRKLSNWQDKNYRCLPTMTLPSRSHQNPSILEFSSLFLCSVLVCSEINLTARGGSRVDQSVINLSALNYKHLLRERLSWAMRRKLQPLVQLRPVDVEYTLESWIKSLDMSVTWKCKIAKIPTNHQIINI